MGVHEGVEASQGSGYEEVEEAGIASRRAIFLLLGRNRPSNSADIENRCREEAACGAGKEDGFCALAVAQLAPAGKNRRAYQGTARGQRVGERGGLKRQVDGLVEPRCGYPRAVRRRGGGAGGGAVRRRHGSL